MSQRAALISAILAATVTGCTVGPDFRTPAAPVVDQYTMAPAQSADMPKLVPAQQVPADWWTVFGSPEIDALVRKALDQSPTLAQARARLTQARELLAARSGATRYPQVDATLGAVRQRIDPATFGFPQAPNPGVFNVFSLGAEASYNFDLAGGTRRELESLAAEVDYQGYEYEAARLTLATNVVVTAIRIAALDAQIAAAGDILTAQRRQLQILEERYALGGVAQLEVQNQRALVAQTDASLAPLRAQRALAQHLLAVLTGEPPAAAQLPPIRLTDLRQPQELPLRLPAELVRQRPDIRASEALLHKASANVGVATAELYPRLVISGAVSSSQLQISDLIGNGINVWNFGANLLQPVFRGGELQARKRAAVAAYDQAEAGYRQAVLQGLQNVADVLRNLESDSQALAALNQQADRSDEVYRITQARYELGGVSQSALLDSERQRRQAQVDRLQALANRHADTAALYQALGGGWIEPVLGVPAN